MPSPHRLFKNSSSAFAGVPGVASDSHDPFKLAIGGGPAVISFPAVDGVLAVAEYIFYCKRAILFLSSSKT